MSAHRWILPATAGLLIGCGTDAGSPFAPERFPARPSASATPACADIEAGGQTFAINAFTFKSFGSVEATVDGEATPVAVTTYLLGAPRATSDGTLLARTSHVLEFGASPDGVCQPGEDCFATDDHAVLDPIDGDGLFRLNTRAGIAVGFGRFAGARARPGATIHGTILLPPPESGVQPVATWSMKGKVCPGAAPAGNS